MRRSASVFAATLLTVGMVAGCATTGGDSSSSETRDSLVFAVNADPTSLDLIQTNDQASQPIWWSLYDTLLMIDEETNEIHGNLAKSWEFNKEGTELTLTLEEGVTFHNGEELTASDVVFTLNRGAESNFVRALLGTYTESEAVNDHTVVLRFSTPYAPILNSLAMINLGIVNEKAVSDAASEEAYAQNPIGTGPYVFKNRVSGDRIELEAFDDYWQGEADIENLTYKVQTDSAAGVLALEKGEIDVMAFVPITDKRHLESVETVKWYETPYTGLVQIIFNNAEGRFADPLLREAVAYAVDREAIIAGAVEGEGTPVQNTITPAVFGFDEGWKNRPHDLEKARGLMAEAGYPDGLDIVVETFQSNNYSTVVEILQAQLAEIGIRIEIKKVEKSVYLEDIISNHDFEMSTIVWGGDTLDADYFYDIIHSSAITNGKNYSEIRNPELDRLLDLGRGTIDREQRLEIYRRVGDILIEDVNFVPLYNYYSPIAANSDLEGVRPSNHFVYRVWEYSWAG